MTQVAYKLMPESTVIFIPLGCFAEHKRNLEIFQTKNELNYVQTGPLGLGFCHFYCSLLAQGLKNLKVFFRESMSIRNHIWLIFI